MLTFLKYSELEKHGEICELVDLILPPEACVSEGSLYDSIGGAIYYVETAIDILTVPGSILDTRLIEAGTEFDSTWVFEEEGKAAYGAVYVVTNNAGGDLYLFEIELLKPFQEGLINLFTPTDNRIAI